LAETGTWQLLAAHGWGSDHRCWDGFAPACAERRWDLGRFDRGYGRFPATSPTWDGPGRRAVVVNSLGLHLVPAAVLAAADAVVLLASFARFVPPGDAGRPLRQALQAMDTRLAAGDVGGLFHEFRERVAAPQPVEHLPAGVEDGPVPAGGVDRLRRDLGLLDRCDSLPEGFPTAAPVLLVEGADDAIVHPASRDDLRQRLPQARVMSLAGVGHGLLLPGLSDRVLGWLDGLEATP
jgi:pimeloyl-[acyl-carrier protein] methyl ester esterase